MGHLRFSLLVRCLPTLRFSQTALQNWEIWKLNITLFENFLSDNAKVMSKQVGSVNE